MTPSVSLPTPPTPPPAPTPSTSVGQAEQRIGEIASRLSQPASFADALAAAGDAEGFDGATASASSSGAAQATASQPSAAGTLRGGPTTLGAMLAASIGQAPPPLLGPLPVGGGGLGAMAATSARASGEWAQRLPEAGQRWAAAIERAANDAGVDPALLAALVQHESGFRPDAVSHAGAIGLAQLMPGTAAGLGVNPRDPEENLAGGARYLREQLDRFGDVRLALAAYNAGPGRVSRAGGIPRITETQNYVERVTSTYDRLR